MNTAEFQDARRRLRQTDEQLAAELGVSTDVVHAWATGRVAIPRQYAQHVAWLADEPEREAALGASGLPECDWLKARDTERPPDGLAAMFRLIEELKRHVNTCPTCVDRERFIVERFGPTPSVPVPWWVRIFAWASRLLS